MSSLPCDAEFTPTQTDAHFVCLLTTGHDGPHRCEFKDYVGYGQHVAVVVTWENETQPGT